MWDQALGGRSPAIEAGKGKDEVDCGPGYDTVNDQDETNHQAADLETHIDCEE